MKYEYRTKPYKHQVRALKKLLRNNYGGALLMDPRTGKSKVFLDFCGVQYLRGVMDRALIICPNHVIDVWAGTKHEAGQVELHFPYEYDIHVWDRTKRHLGLPEPRKNKFLFVLVNIEAFQKPGKRLPSGGRSQKTGRIKHRNEIRRWATDKTCIGLDESHGIASPGARRSTVIVSLHNDAKFRVLMTGTPVRKAKKIHDVYMQWKFLNPGRFAAWKDYNDFKHHFGEWYKPRDIPVELFKRPKNLDELHDLIHLDAFSIEREQCFDLPPNDIEVIKVPLVRAGRAYDQMANEMVTYIRQHTADAPIPLVQLVRLAQITSGYIKTDRNKIITVGHEKIDMLRPRLEQYMDNGEKIVIAARFIPNLELLVKTASKLKVPVYQVRGGMKRSIVSVERAQARKVDGPLIYIVQPQAVAHGVDLSFCSRVVWFSLTNSYVYYKQTNDRIALHRNSTITTHLLAENTYDELMYDELKADGDIIKVIRRAPERLLRDNH